MNKRAFAIGKDLSSGKCGKQLEAKVKRLTPRHTNQNRRTGSITNYDVHTKRK